MAYVYNPDVSLPETIEETKLSNHFYEGMSLGCLKIFRMITGVDVSLGFIV